MPRLMGALQDAGVTVHLDPDEDDLRREYLSMDIAVAVVDGVDAAIAHVNEYGTGHTEAIVTTESGCRTTVHRAGRCRRGDGQRVDRVHRR